MMYQRIAILGLVISAGAVAVIKIALGIIGKQSFYEHITVFYILLGSTLAMNLSFVPHYCLFARKEDKAMVYTTIAGAACSLTLNALLIGTFGLQGAAVATCTSFILIWALKTLYLNKIEHTIR